MLLKCSFSHLLGHVGIGPSESQLLSLVWLLAHLGHYTVPARYKYTGSPWLLLANIQPARQLLQVLVGLHWRA